MNLKISSIFDEQNNRWNVSLAGEIDILSAPKLKEELAFLYEKKQADILLKFDDLNYIDSTGLGVIIGTYGKMKEKGNNISISNPKANILKLLNITNLDKIFIQ